MSAPSLSPKNMPKIPKLLAIDTSCDDTSASVTTGRVVLSNVIASQTQLHKQYGGVFPTVAKEAHRVNIEPSVRMALQRAQTNWDEIDAIAVTIGPGLAPALEVGLRYAETIAKQHQKKLITINHIEAHALSALAQPKSRSLPLAAQLADIEQMQLPALPALAVVISGGHSEFILVKQIGTYEIIGQTIDDAAGECLDKIGRALNLGYPAGPLLEKFAKKGHLGRFELPMAMQGQTTFDLSFSGLKTAARALITKLEAAQHLDAQATYDLAAEVQAAVFGQIIYKLERILLSPDLAQKTYPSRHYLKHLTADTMPQTPIRSIWLGGGVAANRELRRQLRALLNRHAKKTGQQLKLLVPYTNKLCADNAAMIGVTAFYKWQQGLFSTTDILERQPNLKIANSHP